jgi:hypothetical protein
MSPPARIIHELYKRRGSGEVCTAAHKTIVAKTVLGSQNLKLLSDIGTEKQLRMPKV